ncbi:MAG: pseudouridine synthase [Eggerthellaceae bacterium]|nr:pseudouridine synthase [Eggerthellaceae bacterium]
MDDAIRLNRFLARCGLGSRRGCEDLIRAGRVSVNGTVTCDLSVKVLAHEDVVTVDGEPVNLPDDAITIMLHKPSGYVTTMSDPQGRPCVASLVPVDEHPSLFPVGRLDFDTTGLLLFTTDGKLGHALLHPRHHVKKTYYAIVDGAPSVEDLDSLREGILLDDGMTQPAEVELLEGRSREEALALMGAPKVGRINDTVSLVRIAIREGKKRQVKRMLSAIGHPVIALHRPSFGPLLLGDLPRGSWRVLTEEESALLREAMDGEDGPRG